MKPEQGLFFILDNNNKKKHFLLCKKRSVYGFLVTRKGYSHALFTLVEDSDGRAVTVERVGGCHAALTQLRYIIYKHKIMKMMDFYS